MKATIYKNDEFKTVGLYVENAGVKVFSWGATCAQLYYSKTIDADCYTVEILDLVKFETLRSYFEWDFVKEVCEINTDPRNMAKRKDETDNGTFIYMDKDKLNELEKAIARLIEKIK